MNNQKTWLSIINSIIKNLTDVQTLVVIWVSFYTYKWIIYYLKEAFFDPFSFQNLVNKGCFLEDRRNTRLSYISIEKWRRVNLCYKQGIATQKQKDE